MEKREIVKRTILRNRLDGEFMDIFQYTLTVVAAPMGFGKSMSIRDFLERKAAQFIWILMHRDILEELYAVIKKQNLSIAETLHVDKRSEQDTCIELAGVLNSFAADQDLVIVFDNGDKEADSTTERLLQLLMQLLSSHVHIVWICRRRPQFLREDSLFSLYYRIIDKSTLQLDIDEMTELALALDRKCTKQELEWLTEYTDGWFSLVNLLLLKNGHRGINRFWVSRWTTRILTDVAEIQLTQEAKNLLHVMVFSREFTASQAAAVLNMQAEAVYYFLEWLSTETVFLSKVGEKYRIPGCVLDFLKAELQNSETEAVVLGEQNLAQWYVDSGEFAKAIILLNHRGNWKKILEILEKYTIEEFNQTEQEIIKKICSNMPFTQLAEYPIAVIQMAFVVLKTENKGVGEQLLFALKDYVRTHEYENYSRDYILGQIELTLANGEEQRLRAISLLSEVQAWSQGKACLNSWIVPGLLCSFHRIKGGLQAEVEAFKSLCEETEYCMASVSSRCAALLQAEYWFEVGELKQAKYYALESASQDHNEENAFLRICSLFILARVSILEGHREDGLNLMKQLGGEENGQWDNRRFTSMIDICKGYLCATVGKEEQVPVWIFENSAQSHRLSKFSSYGYIIRARLLTERGAFMEFELMSHEWKKNIESNGYLWAKIHYQIHRAISAKELYGIQAAAIELREAFLVALPDHILAPFVENGEALLPILNYIVEHHIIELSPTEIDRLNQLLTTFLKRKIYISDRKNILSKREKEILGLLEKGFNYQEIADELVISKLTVRKHMQNIYEKLNVSDRINALIRAREQMDP